VVEGKRHRATEPATPGPGHTPSGVLLCALCVSVVRFLLLLLLFLPSNEALARDKTYCVSGYTGPASLDSAMGCNTPAVRAKHAKWHFHTWVKRNGACFVCFDEVDFSCITDFLANYRGYERVRNHFTECGPSNTMNDILFHVVEGKDVQAAPPPPPPKADPAPPKPPDPVVLTARLDHVSPGPYAAGDEIELRASLRDGGGAIRAAAGGTFILTTAGGQEVRIPGQVRSDGSITAKATLPTSPDLRIRFEAEAPPLKPHEKLSRGATAEQRIKVDVCALRVGVARPAAGASLVVGQAAALAPAWLQRTGSGSADRPAGMIRLTWTLDAGDGEVVNLPSAADGTVNWTPPETWRGKTVKIRAGGSAGNDQLCPTRSITVSISELGLGLDPTELPEACYVGLACKGTARLVRPEGSARAHVDALLADPATQVVLHDGLDEIWRGAPTADDRYLFERSYAEVGHAPWRVEVIGKAGTVELPVHDVDVRLPLIVNLPELLDLGEIAAGTPFSETCKSLDFSASEAAQQHSWILELTGLEGCDARPVLGFLNALGLPDRRPLGEPLTVQALDPYRPALDLCLETSGCLGEDAPADVRLKITPATPQFADQAKEVRLTWKVTERSFLACYGAWLLPLLAILVVAFIVYGFIRPHRFPAHAAIRIAGSPSALKRQSAIGLVGLPGSGSGWYRSARLGLHPSGELKGQLQHAAIELHAVADGLHLRGGDLEMLERRTRQFEPVSDAATGHAPSPQAVYRVGEVYFRVEV
jgi:hypothetical protein